VDGDYASLKTAPGGSAEPPEKLFPLWAGVERLKPPVLRGLSGEPAGRGVALFSGGVAPAVLRTRIGEGEVFLSALPELFQNRSIGEGDHLALLGRLAGGGRPVYFDEFVHGLEGKTGPLDVLGAWGFGPFLVLCAVAALAAFWRHRVRLGPEEDDFRETRVEAIDFIDSLALLYDRTLRRRQSLVLYRKAFERALAVHTGLRGAALEARIADLLPAAEARPAKGKDLSAAEFARELGRINEAFGRLHDAKHPGSGAKARAGARPA
jgi:hypothetical protein